MNDIPRFVLYCVVLCCVVLYCIVLYCVVLVRSYLLYLFTSCFNDDFNEENIENIPSIFGGIQC